MPVLSAVSVLRPFLIWGGKEDEDDDDDEASDWDESDDWSDEEDLAAFEVEVASFLAAIRQESRQWTGHVGTPEHRRRVRCLLNVVHEPRSLCPLSCRHACLRGPHFPTSI